MLVFSLNRPAADHPFCCRTNPQASLLHLLMTTARRRHPSTVPNTRREWKSTKLVQDLDRLYTPERTSKGRFKPAVLRNETFERIQCKDDFLDYFFTSIHTVLSLEDKREALPGFPYFRNFSSWSPGQKDTAMNIIDEFAEYLVDNFFIPRTFTSLRRSIA